MIKYAWSTGWYYKKFAKPIQLWYWAPDNIWKDAKATAGIGPYLRLWIAFWWTIITAKKKHCGRAGHTLDKIITDEIRGGLHKEVALKAEIRTR